MLRIDGRPKHSVLGRGIKRKLLVITISAVKHPLREAVTKESHHEVKIYQ